MTAADSRPAIVIADEALATLRAQVRSLLGCIDTARRPHPASMIPAGRRNPGPAWKPSADWTIRAIDEPGNEGVISVIVPGSYGDMLALEADEGRAVAMAILAACDWADGTERPAGSYPVEDEPERHGHTFICGPR